MAVGPLARIIAQIVVPVLAVLVRTLPAAMSQALQNARKSGLSDTEAAKSMLRQTITKAEALQILNLSEQEATAEAIQRQYEKYMAANDVKKGGSFYLQSKVYRAKELLEEFQQEKRMEEEQQQTKNQEQDSSKQ